MSEFELDARLVRDTHHLGRLDDIHLLLMDNALVTWLILVPQTAASELYQLEPTQQQALLAASNRLSDYLMHQHPCDKLNVAAIGNIVNQLHLHLVARRRDDFCWPGVVWGERDRLAYEPSQVAEIAHGVAEALGDSFTLDEQFYS